MVFVLTMVTNDNETFSFVTLSAATKRVTDRLRNPYEQQNEQSEGNADASKRDEQKAREHREAVNEGLKRLRTFERRASGK